MAMTAAVATASFVSKSHTFLTSAGGRDSAAPPVRTGPTGMNRWAGGMHRRR